MRGEPNGAKQQDDAENKFRNDGDSALDGRFERRNVIRGLHENKHRAKSHRNDENCGQD